MSKTYYLSSINSDLSGGADFNRLLSLVTETQGSISVTVAKSVTEVSRAYTARNDPNNSDWETGGTTVEVYVDTANTNIYISIQVHRIDSTGTIQQSSDITTEQQATAGLKTFNVTSVDWSAGNPGDRLRIDYRFRNSSSANRTCAIRTGTTDCEVVAPYTFYQRAPCFSQMLGR